MKFLILNTDYPEFLRRLYAQHPGPEKERVAPGQRTMTMNWMERQATA
jgi:hypothetical protein